VHLVGDLIVSANAMRDPVGNSILSHRHELKSDGRIRPAYRRPAPKRVRANSSPQRGSRYPTLPAGTSLDSAAIVASCYRLFELVGSKIQGAEVASSYTPDIRGDIFRTAASAKARE
jgi:hypothetical protein